MSSVRNVFQQVTQKVVSKQTDLSDEIIEEYRMISAFKVSEIIRLRHFFLETTEGMESMSRALFMNIEAIRENPLLDRVCLCFGFLDLDTELDFRGFLIGCAAFNSPALKEQKLRVAFRIQDFDDDGVINEADLTEYVKRITTNLPEDEIEEMVQEVMLEVGNHLDVITFVDFQKAVARLDFQAKLLLPI